MLMVIGLAALTILITTILPRFDILFEGMDKQLPLNVRILMDTAKFITDHFIITTMLIIGPPIALFSYIRTKEGKIFYDRLAIKTPLLADIIRDLETTKIFRTLEVLVSNGVHLATALKISSGVASNLAYQQLLQQATVALKSGQQIGKQLKAEGLFPDLAVDLLSIGEESGQVGQVCGQVADHYENELRTRIKRIIALIEPFFILALAVVVGYVVISMLTVILSINEIAG
jgi:general secretion pathway protein F